MKLRCIDVAPAALGGPANPSASRSYEASMIPLEAVRAYVRHGWRVVAIPRGQRTVTIGKGALEALVKQLAPFHETPQFTTGRDLVCAQQIR